MLGPEKNRLKSYSNKINGKHVFFRERVTERDWELMDYMDGLELVTTNNNCVPQVMVKTSNGCTKLKVVKERDANELLAFGKISVKTNLD